jgi:outer membrane protein assembly factor BamA
LFLFLAFLVWAFPASAKTEADKTARFEISGMGLLRNRELSRLMDDFINPGKVAWLSDAAAENAAFVLISELEDDGYRQPTVKGTVTLLDGTQTRFDFDETLGIAFPRRAGTNIVAFEVERGPRYFVAEVRIEGLTVLDPKSAAAFFQPAFGLFGGRRANVFSDSAVRRGRDALLDALQLSGYAEASVDVRASPLPSPEGAMRLDVIVREGPRWIVSSLRLRDEKQTPLDPSLLAGFIGQPWSDAIRQDASVATRRAYHGLGFPDVSTRVTRETAAAGDGTTGVHATVHVEAGPQVRIGRIRFLGNKRTRESVIKRRVRLTPGEWLDPDALDRARLRLGRLAAFDRVDVSTEPAGDGVRDVIFRFEEADRWEANALFGYGSYEQFRGGVELRRTNLWGRAHQERIFLVQSVKSTRGDYTYTVPELFGEMIDGSARVFGLRRDEFAFRREEYGGAVQLRKSFGRHGPEISTGYTYETLRDKNNVLSGNAPDAGDVDAASVSLGLVLDRRDQAINPRTGHRLHLQAEYASRQFGGEADYQRVEWGAAQHLPLGAERWLHLGITQAAVFTQGADAGELPPVNKLYYPGGDSSLRGYSEGEAAPRAADGFFLGAKTYTLINVEFEQALTRQWSGVLFFDWLTESTRLRDYPGDVRLSSLGLGLRYRTIVGPIRLEYARALNPRPLDAGGAWHLSVGYPF